jgi:hypothetical protein
MPNAVALLLDAVRTLDRDATPETVLVDIPVADGVFHPFPARHREPTGVTALVCTLAALDRMRWCSTCDAVSQEFPLLSILHDAELAEAITMVDTARAVAAPALDPAVVVAAVRTRTDLFTAVDEFLEHVEAARHVIDDLVSRGAPTYEPGIAATAEQCNAALAALHRTTLGSDPLRRLAARLIAEDLGPLSHDGDELVAVALAPAGLRFYAPDRSQWWGIDDEDSYLLANAMRVVYSPYDTLFDASFVSIPRTVASVINQYSPHAVLSELHPDTDETLLETASALRSPNPGDALHSFDAAYAAARRLLTGV